MSEAEGLLLFVNILDIALFLFIILHHWISTLNRGRTYIIENIYDARPKRSFQNQGWKHVYSVRVSVS